EAVHAEDQDLKTHDVLRFFDLLDVIPECLNRESKDVRHQEQSETLDSRWSLPQHELSGGGYDGRE
ncbi:MAG TPA: hypothetical protein VF888_01890, partial [Nitrospirota bacterium]